MPLQNRVNPWGVLCAVSSRGTLMGNRGILHDAHQHIVKPWAHKAWVSCVLAFKDSHRRPFSPGTYSELFFLDEATAFAAGHRPCACCQWGRHLQFKEAWLRANFEENARSSTKMPEVDKVLHQERALRGGGKQTYGASLAQLPLGALFEHDHQAFLLAQRGCLPWSFAGYGAPQAIDAAAVVQVLTPASMVRAFAAGFVRHMHPSAHG